MKNLFAKHEIQFIAWFCVIFLLSVAFLSMIGLMPSEFVPGGGRTFEQVTRDAVREIVEGKPLDPSQDRTGGNTIVAAGGSNSGTSINPDTSVAGTPNSGGGSGAGSTGGSAGGSFGNTNMGSGIGGQPTGGTSAGSQIDTSSQIKTDAGSTMYAEEPTRLVITSIGVDTVISNPKSTAYEVLDAALTRSAVRYPGSGLPGIGNMFIFGHSTGFSVVQNQAYKVFNKLKNVQRGATVTVYSKSAIYEYRVTTVKLVDKSQQLVEFDTTNNMLTLSTCDSFGRDQDRYVVEADLVSVRRV